MQARIISIERPRRWGRILGLSFAMAVVGAGVVWYSEDNEPHQPTLLLKHEPQISGEIGGAAITNPFSDGPTTNSDEEFVSDQIHFPFPVDPLLSKLDTTVQNREVTASEGKSEISLEDGGETAAAEALILYNQYQQNRATPRENFRYLVRLLYEYKLIQVMQTTGTGPFASQFYDVVRQAAQPALRDLLTQIQRNPEDLEGNLDRYNEMANAIWFGDEDPGLLHPDLMEVYAERDRIADILAQKLAERVRKPPFLPM